MLREIDLSEAIRALGEDREVIVLIDIESGSPVVTKFRDLLEMMCGRDGYRFLVEDGVEEAVDPVEEAVEEAPSQLTKKTHESTKSQRLVKQKLRTKTPQVVRKIEPKEEEPFDYGKLGALIRAGKTIDFLQSEFKCTRSQIAARIRIWNKMEEEKNGGIDTEQSDNG